MVSALVVVLVVVATAVVGLLLLVQFPSWRSLAWLDSAFAALTLGVLLLGWLALILAEMNLFSGLNMVLLWLGAAALLAFAAWKQARFAAVDGYQMAQEPAQRREGDRLLALVIGLWLIAAAWLFFRPHEYILGGADAGVYVSLGAEIAQEGGFSVVDETLAAMGPALRAAVLRPLPANPVAPSYLFPGFYVTDAAQGLVVPQFYPLHPVWQAVAFGLSPSAVDGTRAALLLTGLWMTLAGLAIVLIGRELGGRPAALLLLPALAVTTLQVWFARYPTTEALTQYMLWAGLWAIARWFGGRQNSSLWAFMAGAALGSVFLVRIDLLILLPIFGLFVAALWFRGWQAADTWFAVPFAVLVSHSFAHGVLFSAPYFYETVGFGLRLLRVNWWIPVAGLLAALGIFWMAWTIRKRKSKFARFRQPLLAGLIAAFLLFAVYNWFIRPYTSAAIVRPDAYSDTLLLLTNHENFLRLGWYLALPGIWLGVAGICWMVWRVDSRTAVLLAVGLSFTVVYVWNIRANPHQIYVMRRYVPAVVPFFLLGAAVLISQSLRARAPGFRHAGSAGLVAARRCRGAGGFVVSRSWLVGAGLHRSGRLRRAVGAACRRGSGAAA